eukprot:gb/GECH01001459.1/.p1 GENE.gb/GECH01001459.1/~~gb/GECH01001459.1/.p1  ORF type:complete len:327 (+),score=52.36 gb/GECH01001459.1/:1-981(+)
MTILRLIFVLFHYFITVITPFLPSVVCRWIQQAALHVVRCGGVPKHVAFIMDGNRRWARQRGLDQQRGHVSGFMSLENILRYCIDLGVPMLSVYAFSTANFRRSAEEVDALMDLAYDRLSSLGDQHGMATRLGVRVVIAGDLRQVPERVRRAALTVASQTAHHRRLTLYICFAYSSSHEMTEMVREASRKDPVPVECNNHEYGHNHGIRTRLNGGDVMYEDLYDPVPSKPSSLPLPERSSWGVAYPPSHGNDTPASKNCVDLLVRTSGEIRLSDFLTQQVSSHAVIHFTPIMWPEFGLLHLLTAVIMYQMTCRSIRKGKEGANISM